MFLEVWKLKRFQAAKVTFTLIQLHTRHWQWIHSIGHIRFCISAALSCTVNEILSLVSQNLRRSRDTSHIRFGVNPLNPTGLETGLPETHNLYTRKAGIPAHIRTIITPQACYTGQYYSGAQRVKINMRGRQGL